MTKSPLGQLIAVSLVSIWLFSCTSSDKKSNLPPAQSVQPEAQLSDSDENAIETPDQAQENEETSTHHHHPQVWGYSGVIAPEMWHKLDPSFATCGSGKKQSPIDLIWAQPKSGGEIKLMYKEGPISLIDNGHTLQVNFPQGNMAQIHGKTYELKHIDFHSSSEHTLSGNSLPMEAHFVHQDKDGNTAIIGVILIQGAENQMISHLWNQWPTKKFEEANGGSLEIRPDELIPTIRTHYAYQGSLTTPPCTEGVQWIVLNTPVELSKDQILRFRQSYSSNNRPVQKTNGRKVTNY